MKFLCICTYGHSRSVGACRVLHGLGHQAVAIGTATGHTAATILSVWADKIICMTPEGPQLIPQADKHKIVDCDIGPDRWSNPYNQEMLEIIRQKLFERGVI